MGQVTSVTSVGSGSTPSFDSGSDSSVDSAIASLAQSSGVDAGQLGSAVDKLVSALNSGDSKKIGEAVGDLLSLLQGEKKPEEAAPAGGPPPAGGGAPASEGEGDLLSQLEKLLQALGLSKEQISKIMNAAKEAGVGGGDTSAEGAGAGDSVGGVKAA